MWVDFLRVGPGAGEYRAGRKYCPIHRNQTGMQFAAAGTPPTFAGTKRRVRMTDFSRRSFVGAALSISTGVLAPRAFAAPVQNAMPVLLPRALAALDAPRAVRLSRDRLAIADFGKHSADLRLQLVDISGGRVIASYLVAHGRGSDPANTGWLKQFSNRAGSAASAEGSYLTGDTYRGKHGVSRRLIGLDPGNNLALQRGIVIHAADYVCESLIRSQGHIGRSEGCFAVRPDAIAGLLDRLGPGHLLFASR